MSHPKAIDRARSLVWMSEIRSFSEDKSTYAISSWLDPESVWIDRNRNPHQSKWYRYTNGTTTPSKSLVSRVRAKIPKISSDVHHPVWSILRRPGSSQRTIDRLRYSMVPDWKEKLYKICHLPFAHRQITLELVNEFQLQEMGYLDAVLLFSLALSVNNHKDRWVAKRLTVVLLTLPLIYVRDSFWNHQSDELRLIWCIQVRSATRLRD
jgi:hypothetical protein